MEELYFPKENYKVLVRCITYNQSKYIEETLNGFAIQETNFPFVCLVIDDCSVDGEQEVIKSWLEQNCIMQAAEYIEIRDSYIIIVQNKNNTNCFFAIYLLKQNLFKQKERKLEMVKPWRKHCDYEAICEGDDYWIDKEKLALQVEFLDNNSDFGLCYTKCKYYNDNEKKIEQESWGGPNETFNSFLINNTVPTLTVMSRCSLEIKYMEEKHSAGKDWLMTDYPKYLWFSYNSKIKFIDRVTGVYRLLQNSACHSVDIVKRESFLYSQYNIVEYFANLYGYGDKVSSDNLYDQLHRNACMYGDIKLEKKYYRKIKRHNIKQIIKHLVCKNELLYKLFSKKLFYTLK